MGKGYKYFPSGNTVYMAFVCVKSSLDRESEMANFTFAVPYNIYIYIGKTSCFPFTECFQSRRPCGCVGLGV